MNIRTLTFGLAILVMILGISQLILGSFEFTFDDLLTSTEETQEELQEVKTDRSKNSIDVPPGFSVQHITVGKRKVRLDVYNSGRAKTPAIILIHGAAGIAGERAKRYRGFATDLTRDGFVAINVHYFNSRKSDWYKTIQSAVTYAQKIKNVDATRIGLVGYSLGGTIALGVTAKDPRIVATVIESGYMPKDLSQKTMTHMPPLYFTSGDKDESIKTLRSVQSWYHSAGRPFYMKINRGAGHTVTLQLFNQNWRDNLAFLKRTLPPSSTMTPDSVKARLNGFGKKNEKKEYGIRTF